MNINIINNKNIQLKSSKSTTNSKTYKNIENTTIIQVFMHKRF